MIEYILRLKNDSILGYRNIGILKGYSHKLRKIGRDSYITIKNEDSIVAVLETKHILTKTEKEIIVYI